MTAALRELGDLAIIRWEDHALPADLHGLIHEALETGVGWMADFADEWRARPFLDDGEALFLAMRGACPVAMGVISADPFLEAGDVGRLRYIYVGRAARGQGLLHAFIELSLTRGGSRWRRLRLHTDNPVAARVYEGYGFRAVADEHRSTHVRDAQDALVAPAPSVTGAA